MSDFKIHPILQYFNHNVFQEILSNSLSLSQFSWQLHNYLSTYLYLSIYI